MEYSPKERGIWDYYRLVYLVIPLWSQRLLSEDTHEMRLDAARGTAPPPFFSFFLSFHFLLACVCVSVHGSNLLVAQLRDKLVIHTGSVSWSLQNEFGVFRIMASFRR